jgi:thiamine biosynthesis lipoprotein
MVTVLLSALAAGLVAGCDWRRLTHVTNRFYRMDTVVDITLVVPRGSRVEATWEAVDTLLKEWEERFSQTHPRSELRRLNEAAHDTVTVSPVLARMIARSLELGALLDGAFDPTILPIKELWGLGEGENEGSVPADEHIERALDRVDYRAVEVDTATATVRFLRDDITVDVGGVAKGGALQRLGRELESRGYHDYLIAAGGDILAEGRRRDGEAWHIGVQHPRAPDTLLATIRLDGGAVVTSGDYERFRMIDGIRYHHLFDPRTGRSSRHHQSMTVWGRDPVSVDILSTGLFCMEPADVLAFVEGQEGVECMGVDSTGRIYVSEGWQSEVTLPTDTGEDIGTAAALKRD